MIEDLVLKTAEEANIASKETEQINKEAKIQQIKKDLNDCRPVLQGASTNAQLKACFIRLLKYVIREELTSNEL